MHGGTMTQKLKTLSIIVLGSAIYAVATQYFIFSNGLFLGGTSGISVILNCFFPDFSSGEFLMGINILLMLLALIILGKHVAVKTMLGSCLTTIFIGILDHFTPVTVPLIKNPVLSAAIGASMVAVGSAILFFVDSSSGGTDILALIIRKFSGTPIGRALLIADILIVIIGAAISSPLWACASVLGLMIKTFGIDLIIRKLQNPKSAK